MSFLTEVELGHLLLQLVLLLASAHIFGYLFHKCKFPRVIGEIFGGLILGPSVLGQILPEVHQFLFLGSADSGKLLSIFYWMGLIFLMFSAGFKTKASFNKNEKMLIINIILSATLIPFLAGFLSVNVFDFTSYIGDMNSMTAIAVIIGVAVSVTSIPVISKIFIDLGIMGSPFAKIVISASMLQDLILWIAVALATKATIDASSIFNTVFTTLAFIGVLLTLGPLLINKLAKTGINFTLPNSAMGAILILCISVALAANVLKINIIFGALLSGILIGLLPQQQFVEAKNKISDFSLSFFIPLYFAIVGLKINLPQYLDLKFFILFLILSSIIEIGCVFLGTWFVKRNFFTCLNYGIAMNTRGGPGIVLATVAYEAKIINEVFFVTLVLSAIVTSAASGFWFRYALNKSTLFDNMTTDDKTLVKQG